MSENVSISLIYDIYVYYKNMIAHNIIYTHTYIYINTVYTYTYFYSANTV